MRDDLADVGARPAHREVAFGIVGLLGMGRGRWRARAAGLRVRDGREGGECRASEQQTFGRSRAAKMKVCHLDVISVDGERERLKVASMSKPVLILFQTGLERKRYLFDGNAYQMEIITRLKRPGIRAAWRTNECEERR
ncbi:hypothetical protein [Burkholderia pyrrocinia]|uniref:hypothetical protein n=1 Tax=Burkholderia pyrrocinia TaxID=60550 RepID=UPI001F1A388C|nr:hypothetical protein [Burkholderia pyrrocinia]